MRREGKLVLCTCVLYLSFIYWGYLQEKITSTRYCSSSACEESRRWNYPRALNVFMALAASAMAAVVDIVVSPSLSSGKEKLEREKEGVKPSFYLFAKPAITCALGSPLGYMALKYIPFPLVILTKSSKPIPVMLIGILFYRKSYPWYKHLGTLLLCGGIMAFSLWKSSAHSKDDSSDREASPFALLIGIFLVGLNLSLDGYTNNEQEHIFKNYRVTPFAMMRNVNLWQIFFLVMYLIAAHFFMPGESELMSAYELFRDSAEVRYDIAVFCICAALGQLTIFVVMKDFGSLMWITISITRKLFTIVVSVFMFNHVICWQQWLGVAAVFSGLLLEVIMSYSKNAHEEKNKKIQ